MSVRTLALVAVGLLFSGCATTPHGQAVQQTAFGAVLLSGAVGGTVGVVTIAASSSQVGQLQSFAPAMVTGGIVSVVFYAVGIPLLASGAHTLDEEAARGPRADTAPAWNEARTNPETRRREKRKAPTETSWDEPNRKATERQTEAFGACARDVLCFSGDDRCVDVKRMEFDDAADKDKWLDKAGCNQAP